MKTETEIKERLIKLEKHDSRPIDPEVEIVQRATYIRALKWVLDIPR